MEGVVQGQPGTSQPSQAVRRVAFPQHIAAMPAKERNLRTRKPTAEEDEASEAAEGVRCSARPFT